LPAAEFAKAMRRGKPVLADLKLSVHEGKKSVHSVQ
jgi:hypothetical protein